MTEGYGRVAGDAPASKGGRFAPKAYAEVEITLVQRAERDSRIEDLLKDIAGFADGTKHIATKGKDLFLADDPDSVILRHAAQYLVLALATAMHSLPNSFKSQHPDIPWQDITGMRNRIARTHDQISLDIVWEPISNEIPDLMKKLSTPDHVDLGST